MQQLRFVNRFPALFLSGLFFLMATTARAQYPGYCGDGFCNGSEDYFSCAADCAYCGDLFCSPGEDTGSCYMDCSSAYCGDGICNNAETLGSCAADCSGGSPPQPTCQQDVCTSCSRPSYGTDSDADGIPDQLEYDLAHAFFPSVMLKNVQSDLQQSYLYWGRAMPFMVRPAPQVGICAEAFKCLEIRFGLAYAQDFGDSIFAGHAGDSEFYALIVSRTQAWSTAQTGPGYWQMIRDFTAAHWGTSVDSSVYGAYGSCPDAYAGSCSGIPDPSSGERSCFRMTSFEWCVSSGCQWSFSCSVPPACYSSSPAAGAVTLYASEKKHATYHSDSECDHGGFQYYWGEGEDECPNTDLYSLRSFKGELLQNIGNSSTQYLDKMMQYPDMCALYDVWGGQGFAASTPYSEHFNKPLSWCLVN